MTKGHKSKQRRGPKPDTVKITGNWQDAINAALKRKRPPEGWPKPKKDRE